MMKKSFNELDISIHEDWSKVMRNSFLVNFGEWYVIQSCQMKRSFRHDLSMSHFYSIERKSMKWREMIGNYWMSNEGLGIRLMMLSRFFTRNSNGLFVRPESMRTFNIKLGNAMSISPSIRHFQLKEFLEYSKWISSILTDQDSLRTYSHEFSLEMQWPMALDPIPPQSSVKSPFRMVLLDYFGNSSD